MYDLLLEVQREILSSHKEQNKQILDRTHVPMIDRLQDEAVRVQEEPETTQQEQEVHQ